MKAPDTTRSACEAAPGCTYTAGVTTAITATGTVVRTQVSLCLRSFLREICVWLQTAKSLYQANDDIYLGDTAADTILIRGIMTTDWTMGYETSEFFGPEVSP